MRPTLNKPSKPSRFKSALDFGFWISDLVPAGWLKRVAYLFLCLLPLLPAGCKQKASPPHCAITSLQGGIYGQAARILATEFEQQTGIHVTVVEATLSSLREKEITDVLTKGGNYDVMQVPYQWDGEMLPHLQPLTGQEIRLMPDLQDFILAVRTNCGQWGERVYGLPMSCDVITLLYRTDIFAARAAEFKKLTGRPLVPPRTWPEYIEIARFLDSESLYGNIIMGDDQLYTIWSGILYGMGGQPVDPQWRPTLNSEIGLQSLSLFVEMFKYAPPRSETRGVVEANTLFLQGRGAMYLTWPSLLWPQMNDTNVCKVVGKIGAAVIPGGKPQLSSWSLVASPACTNIEAAHRWMAFFVNQANTKRLLLQYGKGSPRLSTYSDPECKEKVFYLPQLLKGLADTQPRFRIPPSQELSDYVDKELLKAIRGQDTPRAALERTAAHWREILIQTGYLHE
jgi:multiple sugar transport system substrate-binding protein